MAVDNNNQVVENNVVEEKTFTQAEVDQLLEARVARENKEHKKALEELKIKHGETVQEYEERIKTASMTAEEKYKYEIDQAKTKATEYESKIKAMEVDSIKKSVLSKNGLSEKFLGKVSGETAEEIEASAKELKESMEEYYKGLAGGTPNKLDGGSKVDGEKDPILDGFDEEYNKY